MKFINRVLLFTFDVEFCNFKVSLGVSISHSLMLQLIFINFKSFIVKFTGTLFFMVIASGHPEK